jgi:hypothetical protein
MHARALSKKGPMITLAKTEDVVLCKPDVERSSFIYFRSSQHISLLHTAVCGEQNYLARKLYNNSYNTVICVTDTLCYTIYSEAVSH